MTPEIKLQWDTAMAWWRGQSELIQRLISRVASDKLVERGAEEVGSSDVNHAVYGMYQEYLSSGSSDVIAFLVDYCNN